MHGFAYDVVVIGSGFGGSVMAYRLAEYGKRVLLLERGRAYPPGTFPRSPAAMARNFWDPSSGLQGLFDVWTFRGIDGVVSSGLGGGSLIYANVMLRKDEKWFVSEDRSSGAYEHWPVTRSMLEPHYEQVEEMLGATPYPFDREPYAQTLKTQAMRDAGQVLEAEWLLPKLAVTFGQNAADPVPGQPFEPPGASYHPGARLTCNLCGECNIGCNSGSKNTLDHTYLAAAARAGAEIRTRHEVRDISRIDGGYRVTFVRHEREGDGRAFDTSTLPIESVDASRVVLAAGTFGTTYLLLRSGLPGISERLGTRFNGNGDLLGFALRCGTPGDQGRQPRFVDATRGPVITSSLRFPDTLDGTGDVGRGFYLQDAGFPAFVAWLAQGLDARQGLRGTFRFLWRYLAKVLGFGGSELDSALSELLSSATVGATSLPLLGMGRDVPDGTFRLKDGWLDLDWRARRSRAYFERVRDANRQVAAALYGKCVINPTFTFGKRLMTVHPLGGCPMAERIEEGVVDAWGEVFGCEGLYVADGSVMPGPVGPNPALTIAALADRFAQRMLENWGRRA